MLTVQKNKPLDKRYEVNVIFGQCSRGTIFSVGGKKMWKMSIEKEMQSLFF